jgi:hypothetical protein
MRVAAFYERQTQGRLKEEGRVEADEQESVRAKSAHSTLFEGRKETQILQFVGFSVWHPDCGSALRQLTETHRQQRI